MKQTITSIMLETRKRETWIRIHNTPYYAPIAKTVLRRLLELIKVRNPKLDFIKLDNTISIGKTYIDVTHNIEL